MNNGAHHNYAFGLKNQWRREVHNRIVERLSVKPSDALVLYLAGPKDLDRVEFLRRGYKEHNLIAIERDADTARNLRTGGRLVLNGALGDFVKTWRKTPVHVVFADLCCGIEVSVIQIVDRLIKNECFAGCVCAFNLLRGRDGRTNHIRALFSECGKHRGLLLFKMYATCLRGELRRLGVIESACEHARDDFDMAVLRNLEDILTACKFPAWHHTYRSSSGQLFDSCAFTNWTPGRVMDSAMNKAFMECAGLGVIRKFESQLRSLSSAARLRVSPQNLNRFDALVKEMCEAELARTWTQIEGLKRESLRNLNATGSMVQRQIDRIPVDLSNRFARRITALKAVRTRTLSV